MKNTINQTVSQISKLNEIILFNAMATSLNTHTKALFVEKIHGRKGWIEYYSNTIKQNKTKELSDLMIVSYDQETKTAKLCFLQAKFKKTKFRYFLNFTGDYFQWELLSQRPKIDDKYCLGFPQDILSFTTYKSITSYGIFYYDNNSKIDMLYSIPDLICPSNPVCPSKLIKKNGNYNIAMRFPGNSYCPKAYCPLNYTNETVLTCDIDIFEEHLIQNKIGAPLNLNIQSFVKGIITNIKKDLGENEVLNTINSGLNVTIDDKYNKGWYPNSLFLVSNKVSNERKTTPNTA